MLPSGGGIRVLRQFVQNLSKRFELSIHVPEGGLLQRAKSTVPETVYPYPMWKKPDGILRPVSPLFLVLRLLSFKKICRQAASYINSCSDAVLVHNCLPVAAPPILQYLTVPSVYFCYEYPRHIYEKELIHRTSNALTELALKPLMMIEKKIDMLSTRAASQIVTFSEYMQGRIGVIYGRNAEIARPGVDSDFFSPSNSPFSRENYVLSVGALWPFKGHETALRILGHIPLELRPGIRIVADRQYPGYREKLLSLALSLSVTITIQNNITDRSLRELYRGARAVLCCQRMEPYGLIPLEAMACGTPVLAIQEGGFTDNIINGITGFLFPGNIERGAELLLRILSEPETANKMVSAGLLFVERERSISSGANKLAEILESL
jgi:glycosyltransferase involved in cell wall biosynthesis